MSQLNQDTIKSLTQLSRIQCTQEEQAAILKDLESILEHFKLLDELNTDNVAPCNQVLEGIQNVMREDVVGETLPREAFLGNAPAQVGGMVRVPPVIKQSTN